MEKPCEPFGRPWKLWGTIIRWAGREFSRSIPEEIGFYLNDGSRGERFGLDEFFERVTNKSGVDKPVAVYQAKAVIEVLKEAVTPQLMEKVKEQLPDEFNPLFEAGSTGNLETVLLLVLGFWLE